MGSLTQRVQRLRFHLVPNVKYNKQIFAVWEHFLKFYSRTYKQLRLETKVSIVKMQKLIK